MELRPYVLQKDGGGVSELVETLSRANDNLQDVDNGRALPLDAQQLVSLIPRGGSRSVLAYPR